MYLGLAAFFPGNMCGTNWPCLLGVSFNTQGERELVNRVYESYKPVILSC